MYAFVPVSLAALQQRGPDQPRTYRVPWPKLMNPAGFVAANLIIYWAARGDVEAARRDLHRTRRV